MADADLTFEEAHSLLGIGPGDGPEAVARAFRAAAKRFHPDRPGGDASRFQRVTEAYRLLQSGAVCEAPPSPAMDVRGADIWIVAEVPVFVLERGGRATVETPRGPRTLWIDRAAAERRRLRLAGEGTPATADSPAGDLVIELEPAAIVESATRTRLRQFIAAWAR